MYIDWNIGAFEELRRRADVAAMVDGAGERIAAAAGDGFEASSYEGATRHRCSVMTTISKAMVVNARDNTLLGALDAGR